MKRALIIILFSFLSVVGIFGLVIGGMYLFGGFDEKPVFAQELHFSQTQVISSTAFELDLLTNTENVTRRKVKLETTGDNIIYFEPTATIGGRVRIAPRRDNNNNNIGGYVKLTARYYDDDSTSTAIATCHIIIDVPVDEVNTSRIDSKMYGEDILLAEQDSKLSDLIGVSPSNSLMPYLSPSRIINTPFTSTLNKKVFLQVLVNGEANPNLATLKVGTIESTLIELPYSYSSSLNSFAILQNIFVSPKRPNMEVAISSYVVPTFEMMNSGDVTMDKITSLGLMNNTTSFYVKNYSIDNMLFDKSDKTVFLGEEKKFYLNNPLATDDINLNLSLTNNKLIPVDDALLKDYLTVNIIDNGLTFDNVTLVTENLAKSEWHFAYSYSSFYTYSNYSSRPIDSNKIKVELIYDDGDSRIEEGFYLIPEIRNVDSLRVNNTSNTFLIKNGEDFSLNDRVEAVYSGVEPLSKKIGYFVQYSNNISTMPLSQSSYKVTFDFTLPANGKITSIYRASTWTDIKDTFVTMTQDGNTIFKINYDSSGNGAVQVNETAQGHVPISVVIDNCTINTSFASQANLFTISTDVGEVTINNRQTKFYAINNNVVDSLPYLSINSIIYRADFDYFSSDGTNYILLKDVSQNMDFTLNGVGSFTILARVIFEIGDNIYLLFGSVTFRVEVIEVINSGDILAFQGESDSAFASLSLEFNEFDDAKENREGYIYITSPKISALSNAISEGNILVSFTQDFGKTNEEFISSPSLSSVLSNDETGEKLTDIKTKLNNINKNAISFGNSWVAVYSGDDIVGYKIKYNILEVHTITLDGEDLNNNFNISIAYAPSDEHNVLATFVSASQNQDYLTFVINDRVVTSVAFAYSGVETDSLTLEACVANDGSLEWRVNELYSATKLYDLTYGFKYNNNSAIVPMTSKHSLFIEENGVYKDLSGVFYSFDTNGVLSFKNIPYAENGKKIRFEIKMDTLSDNNFHYVYNAVTNTFDRKIYDEVVNGKYLEFTIYGMEITLTPNDIELIGSKGSQTRLLSAQETDSIFKVSMSSHAQSGISTSTLVKYEEFFSLVIVKNNQQKAHEYVSVNNGFLSIDKEFLKNETVRFGFSYFLDDEYLLLINGNNIFDKEITSAFELVVEDSFLSPSTQTYATIRYLSSADLTQFNITATKLNDKNVDKYSLDNSANTITFKTYYQPFHIDLKITISCIEEEEVRSVDVEFKDIAVNPLYKDSEIEVGRLDQEGDDLIPNEMLAGKSGEISITTGSIRFNNGLLSAFNNSLMSAVNITFDDVAISSVSATDHMSQNGYVSPSAFGFFSFDMNIEKYVKVIFDISFTDGGNYVVSKIIHIQPNLEVIWKTANLSDHALYLNSGDSVNLTLHSNYIVYKNGQYFGTLREEDFAENELDSSSRYTRESFEFLDNEDSSYFYQSGSILYVINDASRVGQVQVNLVFKYVVDTEVNTSSMYYLNIIMPISLNITAS